MIFQNIGHIILVIAATVVGFVLYDNVICSLKKEYLENHAIDKETRREMEKEDAHDRLIMIIRLAIWCLCAAFALTGNILGIILAVPFTIDALVYIYHGAYLASKSTAAALTFLAVPFGALIMACTMSPIGIIGGILLGILTVVLVQLIRLISLQLKKED